MIDSSEFKCRNSGSVLLLFSMNILTNSSFREHGHGSKYFVEKFEFLDHPSAQLFMKNSSDVQCTDVIGTIHDDTSLSVKSRYRMYVEKL